jgi:hypothetical protein
MARTSTTPFSSQTTATLELAVPKLDMGTNYAVTEDGSGQTVIKNITSAEPTLEERITFKYTENKAQDWNLQRVNARTSNLGYTFSITDAYIQRTTEDDGTIHDDPVKVQLLFTAPRGSNIITGNDIDAIVMRLLGAYKLQTGSTASNAAIDRLMRGATKPAVLV